MSYGTMHQFIVMLRNLSGTKTVSSVNCLLNRMLYYELGDYIGVFVSISVLFLIVSPNFSPVEKLFHII